MPDANPAPAPDSVMNRVGEAIALIQHKDRAGARSLLMDLWEEVGGNGDALHRCAIAHQLADVQDELDNELGWDLEALAAADALSDDRLAAAGAAATVQGLYPSLHLNLADVYRRLGDRAHAQVHIQLGRRFCEGLPDDDYGQMIRAALDRVVQRLRSFPSL
jgi:hypothetical protein